MKQQEYLLQSEGVSEIVERRSRFVGIAFSLSGAEELRAKLKDLEREYPEASHYCYAFQVGIGSTKVQGMSDAGEPRGTAGRPMLDVLKGSGITNCCVVVVRYFGGTKLGTGGLVRCYQAAARASLDNAEKSLYVSRETIRVRIPYNAHGALKQLVGSFDASIVDETFSEDIQLVISAESENCSVLVEKIRDLTRGEAGIDREEPR